MITVTLPLAPSVNGAFANVHGKGRVRTAPYKTWAQSAGWELKAQRPIRCDCDRLEVVIALPEKMPGDVDNRVKPTLDLLVSLGLIRDDSHVYELRVHRSTLVPTGRMRVSYGPAGEAKAA